MSYSSRPVPQNIMSFEFKLFELFTVKQLLISFGIFFLSILIYSFGPDTWRVVIPIILILGTIVVMFIPFNGEPFLVFLSNFIEAFISPQRRVWNRKGVIVRSAAQKAMAYKYGEDFVEDNGGFLYKNMRTLKNVPGQEDIDKAEKEFLEHKTDMANYTPPTYKSTSGSNSSDASGTNVSQRSVVATVDLNQYQQTQQQSNQSAMQAQNQQANNQVQVPYSQQQQAPTHLAKENYNQPNTSQNQISNQPLQINIQNVNPQQHSLEQNQNSNISNNTAQSMQELQSMMAPKKVTPEDEFAPKNYIFGSIENGDKPVSGAGIVLKRGNENLEVIYSNEVGEFQSFSEYKAGDYILYVNVDSKEFNQVLIHHDPIDPMPIIIKSKFAKEKVVENEEDDLKTIQSSSSEVFDGSYDSKIFDLGQDYSDLDESPALPANQNISNEMPTQENFSIQTNVTPEIPSSEILPQAEIIQNQPTYISEVNQQTQVVENKIEQVSQPTPQPATNHLRSAFNFLGLSNAQASFDLNYVNIPNTFNGIIIDKSGNPIHGVLVNIMDFSGNIIRTVASDNQGIFYCFASIPSGKYLIDFIKPSSDFARYSAEITGNIIPPKIIQSIN